MFDNTMRLAQTGEVYREDFTGSFAADVDAYPVDRDTSLEAIAALYRQSLTGRGWSVLPDPWKHATRPWACKDALALHVHPDANGFSLQMRWSWRGPCASSAKRVSHSSIRGVCHA